MLVTTHNKVEPLLGHLVRYRWLGGFGKVWDDDRRISPTSPGSRPCRWAIRSGARCWAFNKEQGSTRRDWTVAGSRTPPAPGPARHARARAHGAVSSTTTANEQCDHRGAAALTSSAASRPAGISSSRWPSPGCSPMALPGREAPPVHLCPGGGEDERRVPDALLFRRPRREAETSQMDDLPPRRTRARRSSRPWAEERAEEGPVLLHRAPTATPSPPPAGTT